MLIETTVMKRVSHLPDITDNEESSSYLANTRYLLDNNFYHSQDKSKQSHSAIPISQNQMSRAVVIIFSFIRL